MRTSDAPPTTPLFSTRDAANYLRFKSTSGIRTTVMRGELVPCGAGPKACHMFTIDELDRFVAARATRYARIVGADRAQR